MHSPHRAHSVLTRQYLHIYVQHRGKTHLMRISIHELTFGYRLLSSQNTWPYWYFCIFFWRITIHIVDKSSAQMFPGNSSFFVFSILMYYFRWWEKQRQDLKHLLITGYKSNFSAMFHLHICTVLILQTLLLPSASCSEPMWDFLPWPSRLSERALWTSPHATWIILWAFCCARPNALWTCLPAWRPSTCHCGRALRALCSSLASWCTCSTGSTHHGYPWDLCPRQHCTIPCGLCTAPLYNKVRNKWDRV